jgi:two-component system, NarL family, sensor kinase
MRKKNRTFAIESMRNMNRTVLIVLFSFGLTPAFAQPGWTHKRDSLVNALAHSKEDTNRVWTLERLGVHYANNNFDSTYYYANAYYQLSQKLKFPTGIVSGLSMRAWYLSNHLNSRDSAIALDLEAIRIGKQANLKKMLGNVYNNVASIYGEKKEDFTSAVAFYLKALNIYEQMRDTGLSAMASSNIGVTYISLKEYKKSYFYCLQAITTFRSMNLDPSRPAFLALADALAGMERYDTALSVLSEGKIIAEKTDDPDYTQGILMRQIHIYTVTKRLPLLKKASEDLLVVSRSVSSNVLNQGWGGLSDYYFYNHDYRRASIYNDSSISETIIERELGPLKDAYERKARIELAEGHLTQFDRYTKSHDSLADLLLSDKILKNTQELEAKYTLDKEQAQINSLNDEKKISQLTLREHRWAIWTLSAILVIFAVFGFLFYSNSLHRKRLFLSEAALQRQKIIDLEKERQLLATRSVLTGQDEERERLAKDLHDGLGGILSVAKYSFTNMKQNLIISAENALAFDKSMGYLDRSIQELRRVAHNMMPVALIEFGLDTALQDYCNSITNSGVMQITYRSYDLSDKSVSPATASVIYRIIQELINNILKHAAAPSATVQLVKRSDILNISVEDNGKGFDVQTLKTNTGIGFLNLQNRVSYLQGTLDFQSTPGKGTFVNIDIPISTS